MCIDWSFEWCLLAFRTISDYVAIVNMEYESIMLNNRYVLLI